ncbi:hypothetical protein [Aquimarina pacifica]|uniref:hypothetical protein n=1 Tax=Aquimarina pacifica TaxID=1296415 RepID=UPI0004700A91|nr:hypothetical protein [Aquimarina pacifica]
MNTKKTLLKGNTIKDPKYTWVYLGVTALALGGIGYWYYRKKRGQDDTDLLSKELGQMTSTLTKRTTAPTTVGGRFRCTNRKNYPLAYGTCMKDVEMLQQYLLKVHQADLGRSGPHKNGVDGMFGNKTNKAAKKYLGKTSFSRNDIESMKMANKIIKR